MGGLRLTKSTGRKLIRGCLGCKAWGMVVRALGVERFGALWNNGGNKAAGILHI